MHDFRLRVLSLGLGGTGGFKNGLNLHLIDFREGDPKAATAPAQHRIGFQKLLGPQHQLVSRQARRRSHSLHILFGVGQELVQRRIKQADGDRQIIHDLEQLFKI